MQSIGWDNRHASCVRQLGMVCDGNLQLPFDDGPDLFMGVLVNMNR